MKALVIGGTGFIGRRLVRQLLEADWDVTIATSGKTPSPFGADVKYLTADRFDREKGLSSLASAGSFDVLFDQQCFDADDAAAVVENFAGKIRQYVFVSSGAVYRYEDGNPQDSGMKKESDFDAKAQSIEMGKWKDIGYSAGKRNAEAYIFQKAPFPAAAARFPIVIGHDDSTHRFQKCIGEVLSRQKITIPAGGGRRTFVWADDAGRFLSWLATERKTGAYNAASDHALDALEIVQRLSRALDRNPHVERGNTQERYPFYYAPADAIVSVAKAEGEGFKFTPFDRWFATEVSLAASAIEGRQL